MNILILRRLNEFRYKSLVKHCANYSSIRGRDFLTLRDYSKEEIYRLLWTASDLKKRYKFEKEFTFRPLEGKSVAMIFQKLSTRTRLSAESGFALLGAHPIIINQNDIHLGKNETIEDTARVLSRFNDAILARVYDHKDLDCLSRNASVPVINGLSDCYHPLQLLADLLTLQEHYGKIRGLSVAWVGDGNNNMTHSYIIACGKLGLNLKVASPAQYQPDPGVIKYGKELCEKNNCSLTLTTDPIEAVRNSDVIVTDTFVSMGREQDKAQRLKDFKGYQVDKNLISVASSQWSFLHCLPRKPEEVTDEIFYDENRSLVWNEAENRKWTVMAVLLNILSDYDPSSAMPQFE